MSDHLEAKSSSLKQPVGSKIKRIWQQLFPNHLFLLFLGCVGLKLIFMGYRLYLLNAGLSQAQDAIFVQIIDFWWHLEGLSDYSSDFLLFRENWMNAQILYSPAFENQYDFPPLFYYLLHIFTWWTPLSAPIILFIAHISTAVVLYHLFREMGFTSNSAQCSFVLFLLSPINLYYNDFIWQYPSLMLFFLSLASLKFIQKHYKIAMLMLGAAMSVHQIAFWVYPVFIIGLYFSMQSDKSTLKYSRSVFLKRFMFLFLLPLLIFLFFSFPYLILYPETFIDSIGSNWKGVNLNELRIIYTHVDIYFSNEALIGYFPDLTLIGKNGFQVNYRSSIAVACFWIGYVFGFAQNIILIVALMFELQVFLIFFYCVIGGLWWWHLSFNKISSILSMENKKNHIDSQISSKIFVYVLYLVLFAVLLFRSEGIYKFQFIWLTPFWAAFGFLSFPIKKDYKASFFSSRLFHIVGILVVQLIIMYIHKWLAPLLLYFPLFCISLGNFIEFIFSNRKTNYIRLNGA